MAVAAPDTSVAPLAMLRITVSVAQAKRLEEKAPEH